MHALFVPHPLPEGDLATAIPTGKDWLEAEPDLFKDFTGDSWWFPWPRGNQIA